MNQDQITGIIRAIVPALLAYAVGKGLITENSVADITAAIVAIAAAGWSIYTNAFRQKIQSIAASPAGIEAAKQTVPTPATIVLAEALKEKP